MKNPWLTTETRIATPTVKTTVLEMVSVLMGYLRLLSSQKNPLFCGYTATSSTKEGIPTEIKLFNGWGSVLEQARGKRMRQSHTHTQKRIHQQELEFWKSGKHVFVCLEFTNFDDIIYLHRHKIRISITTRAVTSRSGSIPSNLSHWFLARGMNGDVKNA